MFYVLVFRLIYIHVTHCDLFLIFLTFFVRAL